MAFRPWAASLPSDVELYAVEYPGRASREEELPWTDVRRLSAAVLDAAAPILDRPFAVVGFSLGALVAFEWLRGLAAAGGPPPLQFFACARRAPQMQPRFPPVHGLPDEDLLSDVQRRFGAIPDVLLRERELLARFLVPLRADLAAVETYRHEPGEPLGVPIHAVGGCRDPDVTADELRGWSAHTRDRFGLEMLDAGHFFADSPRLRESVLSSLVP